MSTDCTGIVLLATQAAHNLAIIIIVLVIAIALTLYSRTDCQDSCLYLSGTISRQEEQKDQEQIGVDHAITH